MFTLKDVTTYSDHESFSIALYYNGDRCRGFSVMKGECMLNVAARLEKLAQDLFKDHRRG